MKKLFLSLFMVLSAIGSIKAEPVSVPVHDKLPEDNVERNRNPINLPIKVYYDSDTNMVEVWCDNDNIYGEVFVYDETGALEVYSAYMNVSLPLSTTGHHSILIKGDGWESIGDF